MSLDTLPDHIRRPHVRPFQPLPIQKGDQKFVALRDPSMLQKQTMVVPLPAVQIVQHFQGKETVEDLATRFQRSPEQVVELAKGLDSLGLLWGPTFETLESARWDEFQKRKSFPAGASASLGEDEATCRAAIDGYFEQTDDPELEQAVTAIVAPHLDYERGWPNYAAAYYSWRETDAPDRVVVLGTNHFGLGRDAVVFTELGFETPLGQCPTDESVTRPMIERFGRPLIIDQLDHLPEHSIELQIPWIQYCWGNVPIVAALIPDPLLEPVEDEEERVTIDNFLDALRETLDDVGGTTYMVASSDLSHVGPQFGEPRPVDEQRRIDVERHDRDMMSKFLAGDAEEFLAAMRWNKNPTSWCSVGNMNALLRLTDANAIELIDYRQAFDERGLALVSSAAMAVV